MHAARPERFRRPVSVLEAAELSLDLHPVEQVVIVKDRQPCELTLVARDRSKLLPMTSEMST